MISICFRKHNHFSVPFFVIVLGQIQPAFPLSSHSVPLNDTAPVLRAFCLCRSHNNAGSRLGGQAKHPRSHYPDHLDIPLLQVSFSLPPATFPAGSTTPMLGSQVVRGLVNKWVARSRVTRTGLTTGRGRVMGVPSSNTFPGCVAFMSL